jgi:Tfp pilus assembly protein FimT
MPIKSWFTKNSGFTLVELTAVVGLTGIMFFFVAEFSKNQSQNDALIKAKADISKTVGIVEGSIRNRTVCKAMMQGKVPTAAGIDIPTLNYITSTGASKTVIQQNRDYGTFRIGNPAAATTNNIVLKTSGVANTILDLVIKFTIKGKQPRVLERKIPFVVSLNAAGAILDCGPLLADSNTAAKKEFCESLPGVATWDNATSQCNLNNNLRCPTGQVVERMTSLGGLICVPALNRVDPNNLFDTTPLDCTNKPNIRLQSINGKIKAVCDASACSPVHGAWANWGSWGSWSNCNAGYKFRSRQRFCNNPTPSCGGSACPGCVGAGCPTSSYDEETYACYLPNGQPCGCTWPDSCNRCINPPNNTCSPSGQGFCGQTIPCSPEPMCP